MSNNFLNKNIYLNRFNIMIKQWRSWAESHILGIFVFNLLTVLMLLLKSAGYFAPYLPLNINLLFFISLALLIVLLDFRSKALFTLSLIFLVFTGILKIFAINVWAERSALYMFEALILGVVILIISNIKNDD